MHLQQSKNTSRKSGGQQYWLQGLPKWLKHHLDAEKFCPVLLQTPYGLTKTSFRALHPRWKFVAAGKLVKANAYHYRVQADEANTSIGEAIRSWFGLRKQGDFERIELSAPTMHRENFLILTPTVVSMRNGSRVERLQRIRDPLSFCRDYHSKLWTEQIAKLRAADANTLAWVKDQLATVVRDNKSGKWANILECDLLRAAGALGHLGLELSPYLGRGLDCIDSKFRFGTLPPYTCPVEIKKRSSGFKYQMQNYTQLPRAVILCLQHDLAELPEHVDVLELSAFDQYLAT